MDIGEFYYYYYYYYYSFIYLLHQTVASTNMEVSCTLDLG